MWSVHNAILRGADKRLYYDAELEVDFDLQEDVADRMVAPYHCLYGDIHFFMAECPGCGRTMPFELDEGVCMRCGCDPADEVVEDMDSTEEARLLKDNLYRMRIPMLIRREFETVPSLVSRQVSYRCDSALKKYALLCHVRSLEGVE